MAILTELIAHLRADAADWRQIDLATLLYPRRAEALTVCLLLVGLSFAMLIVRSVLRRVPGRDRIVVPAILATGRRSRLSMIRHCPLVLFLMGLPLFMMAVADPRTAVAETEVTYPGRRIALLIDASSSMMVPFPASRLRDSSPNEAVFLTTVAAAEAFVRQRQAGKYRDVIALVEFGDEAYVVTPFTTDYDTVLLSLSLVGDWTEYLQFPDGGTAIGRAIVRGTDLFKAFDFLHASGNVMIIFSDGQDTQVTTGKTTLDQVLAAAVAAKLPVYLVRTGRDKPLGEVVPDAIWKPAVESTGGRFYAAATENDVIQAIADIDRRSSGTIERKQYSVERPRFALFAIAAAALWAIALALKVTFTLFARFP